MLFIVPARSKKKLRGKGVGTDKVLQGVQAVDAIQVRACVPEMGGWIETER